MSQGAKTNSSLCRMSYFESNTKSPSQIMIEETLSTMDHTISPMRTIMTGQQLQGGQGAISGRLVYKEKEAQVRQQEAPFCCRSPCHGEVNPGTSAKWNAFLLLVSLFDPRSKISTSI